MFKKLKEIFSTKSEERDNNLSENNVDEENIKIRLIHNLQSKLKNIAPIVFEDYENIERSEKQKQRFEIAKTNFAILVELGTPKRVIEKRLNEYVNKETDLAWSLYNSYIQALMEASSQVDDKRLLNETFSTVYSYMAKMLKDEGKESHHVQQKLMIFQLKSLKSANITGVEVLGGYGRECTTPKKVDGKRYSLDEALEEMPIPIKECEKGFCDCIYLPIT